MAFPSCTKTSWAVSPSFRAPSEHIAHCLTVIHLAPSGLASSALTFASSVWPAGSSELAKRSPCSAAPHPASGVIKRSSDQIWCQSSCWVGLSLFTYKKAAMLGRSTPCPKKEASRCKVGSGSTNSHAMFEGASARYTRDKRPTREETHMKPEHGPLEDDVSL